jgi:alpha-mannosidase
VSYLFSPVEAPLVQLGGINSGKYLDNIELKNGTIASFPMNNHWWTNSPASQCGRFEFKYFITSISSSFNPTLANKFGWASHFPLGSDYISMKDNKKGYKKFSFIDGSLPENILLIGLKKAEEGLGVILRLAETSGRSSNCNLTFNGKTIKRAYLVNPVEEKIKTMDIYLKNREIKMEFKPFEILTFYIEFY